MDHLIYLYRGADGRMMTRDFFMDIAAVMETANFLTIRSQYQSDKILKPFGGSNFITFVISKKLQWDRSRAWDNEVSFADDRRIYGYSRVSFWDGNDEFCEFLGLRNDVIDHIARFVDYTFFYAHYESGNDGRYIGHHIDFDEHLYPTISGEGIGFFSCEDESHPILGNECDFSYSDDDRRYRDSDNIPCDSDDEDDVDDVDDESEYSPERYVNGYHHGRSEFIRDRRAENNGYYIGFEIEKEDESVRNSITLSEFRTAFPYWRKERDGSLNSKSGYELISPVLPLDIDFIRQIFKNSPILTRHVNADFSSKCGGHINISDENRSPEILFDDIAGYFPILAALYPSRCDSDYSKLYGKIKMKNGSAGRSAFYLRSDRIELRIFPAVRNVENLLFRARLVRYMMENPARFLSDVNMDDIAVLCDMIHNTESKRIAFLERIEKFDSIIFEPVI